MIGKRVEFPVDLGEWREGIAESFVEETGLLTVRDDDGALWKGYEYQVMEVRPGVAML